MKIPHVNSHVPLRVQVHHLKPTGTGVHLSPDELGSKMSRLQQRLAEEAHVYETSTGILKGFNLTADVGLIAASVNFGPVGIAVAGASTYLIDFCFQAAIEKTNQCAKAAALKIIDHAMPSLRDEQKKAIEEAFQNDSLEKVTEKLLAIPVVSDYLNFFTDPDERAMAQCHLMGGLEDWTKGFAVAQHARTSDLEFKVKNLNKEIKFLRQQDQGFEVASVEFTEGIKVLEKELCSLNERQKKGEPLSEKLIKEVELLQKLYTMNLSPEQQYALLKSGDLKLSEIEIKKIERAVTAKQYIANAQWARGQLRDAVSAVQCWGIDPPKGLTKLVNITDTALDVFGKFMSGNYLGAGLSFVGGLGRTFGKERIDIGSHRHEQVVKLLQNGLQLQIQGYDELLNQGQLTLNCVMNVGANVNRVYNQVALLGKEVERVLSKMHADNLEGQRKILEHVYVVIQQQVQHSVELAKIQEGLVLLSDEVQLVYQGLSSGLSSIYRDVFLNRILILDMLASDIRRWRSIVDELKSSDNFDSQSGFFVTYEKMVQWYTFYRNNIKDAFLNYLTIFPQKGKHPISGLSLLLWQTHESSAVLGAKNLKPDFRLEIYEPLFEYYQMLDDSTQKQMVASLMMAVLTTRDMSKKIKMQSIKTATEFAHEMHSYEFVSNFQNLKKLIHFQFLTEIVHDLPLLCALITLDNGTNGLMSREELLSASTNFPNASSRKSLLERAKQMIDLAIAQHNLIAGDFIVDHLWNTFFKDINHLKMSEAQKNALFKILYGTEKMSLQGENRKILDSYFENPLSFDLENRRKLIEVLKKPIMNNIFADNLMRYSVSKVLGETQLALNYGFALHTAPLPHALNALFPDWIFIYDDKDEQWYALILIPQSDEYLFFPMPSQYEIESGDIRYHHFFLEIIKAEREISGALKEITVENNPEIRELIVDFVNIQQ